MFDRVVVEKAATETQTKGGIMIPEKAQGKVLEGTVLAAGPGARTDVSLKKFMYLISFYLSN